MSAEYRRPRPSIFDDIGLATREFLERYEIEQKEDMQPRHEALIKETVCSHIAPLAWILPEVQVRAISDNLVFSAVGDPLGDMPGLVLERAAYACGEFADIQVAPYYETNRGDYTMGALLVLDGVVLHEGKTNTGQVAVPLDGRADISFVATPLYQN